MILIRQEQLDWFRNASGDENSLHVDPMYARKTPYGSVANYGVGTLLLALGKALRGRCCLVSELECQWSLPVSLGDSLRVEIAENISNMVLKVFRNSESVMRAKIGFEFRDRFDLQEFRSPRYSSSGPRDFSYRCGWTEAEEAKLNQYFELRYRQLPAALWNIFLGASTYVGMVFPGRQALFSKLSVRLDPGEDFKEVWRIEKIETDDRFALSEITARLGDQTEIVMEAFRRPAPIALSAAGVRESVSCARYFESKNALIIGASRGFGAAAAAAFGANCARVGVQYFRSADEAGAVLKTITELGGQGYLIQGNATEPRHWADKVEPDIDFLVLNASPAIKKMFFFQSSDAMISDFVGESLQMTIGVFRALAPKLRPDATILFVSSVYVDQAPVGFSHYVAAKSAIESALIVISKENPNYKVGCIRAPKMLTDQTNAIVAEEGLISPLRVAGNLLARMGLLNSGFQILEVFE